MVGFNKIYKVQFKNGLSLV